MGSMWQVIEERNTKRYNIFLTSSMSQFYLWDAHYSTLVYLPNYQARGNDWMTY